MDQSASTKSSADMQLRVVLRDETGAWPDDIQQRAGRIFAAYLLDASQALNLAEITPSYELTYLYSTSLMGRDDDELQSELAAHGAGDGVLYVHCRVVDSMPASRVHVCTGLPIDYPGIENDTHDEVFEACREHFVCNVVIDLPRGEFPVHAAIDGDGERPASPSDSSAADVPRRRSMCP